MLLRLTDKGRKAYSEAKRRWDRWITDSIDSLPPWEDLVDEEEIQDDILFELGLRAEIEDSDLIEAIQEEGTERLTRKVLGQMVEKRLIEVVR